MASAENAASAKTSRAVPARHQFLDNLIDGLTGSEWRYLRDRLMQRHYHCDVFGQLPLDLVLCVAAYLDPLDIVALRRVSKRWHSLLTAERISKQVYLACWPWEHPSDSANWTKHLEQRLCCEHSLACGRPWSKAEYPDTVLDLPSEYIFYWQLYGCNFAWCGTVSPRNLREHITVLSLETGIVSRHFPLSRSPLRKETLVLSDLLIGCISNDGYCEIFEISSGTCHSFRLPSTAYRKLVLQADKIACINIDTDTAKSTMLLHIITWDLKSRAHRHTSVDVFKEPESPVHVRVEKLEWILEYDSIHMIEPGMSSEIWLMEFGASIYQTQDAATSPSICKVREISTVQNRTVSAKEFRMDGSQRSLPVEDLPETCLMDDVIIIPQQELGSSWRYHFKLASFDCWIYGLKSPYPTYSPPDDIVGSLYTAPRPISPSTYGIMTSNSGTNYFRDGFCIKLISWECGQKTIREAVPEMFDTEELMELEQESLLRTEFLGGGNAISRGLVRSSSHWPLFGNRRFFVFIGFRKIKVYCFDRDFVLAREDLSYRRGRDEKARARKLKMLHESLAADSVKDCLNGSSSSRWSR